MLRVRRAAIAFATLLLAGAVLSAPQPSAAAVYCTSAIDIGGIFCAIGCPNECSCNFGAYVSQCCC
jgi:hypothetical protein